MKLKNYYLFALAIICSLSMYGQQNDVVPNTQQGPTEVSSFDSMVYVPSIASRRDALVPFVDIAKEAKDKRSLMPNVVIGPDPHPVDDYLASNPHSASQTIEMAPPFLVFDGYSSGASPTDPSMAIGPNHVIVTWNTAFAIYDKAGGVLQGPTAPNPAIFPGGGCCDLTVTYDTDADRWVLTFLGPTQSIAVSDGPDPINDGWFVYSQGFNDYQKLSVWSDGYYMTQNSQSANKVFALERDEMLAGNPAAQIVAFNLPGIAGTTPFFSPQFLNVSDGNMPADGGATVIFLQDDAFGGIASDHIKYWTIDMDWAIIGNSTISAATEIATTPFISVFDGGGFSNLTQPGGGVPIDAVQNTVMNMAQFRKFAGHNSALFNFVVDTDGGGGELAGVRWYEFRQPADNTPWTLFQEGTYTSPDGKHAWMGGMIMDASGNIALGYSAMAGPTTSNPTNFRVGSYYTGRFDGDPLGTMTVIEEPIGATSTNNVPNLRYCDYNKMTIDPSNDSDFWFINEVMQGSRRGRIGAFTLAPPIPNDIGMLSITEPNDGPLTATETIEVTIRNFGSNDITNPEVQYTIDGGAAVVENYVGTIVAQTTESFIFSQTADLSTPETSYDIEARTNLAGDSNTNNDIATKTVNTTLSVEEQQLVESRLIVVTKPDKQFEITLVTSFDGNASIRIYNQLGQTLVFSNLEKDGDRYVYKLDMSFASSGVYFIQIGDRSSNYFRTAKIVVR